MSDPGRHPWCRATVTMPECPHRRECLANHAPVDPELCFERRGEWALYRRYELAEDDPSFNIPEPGGW